MTGSRHGSLGVQIFERNLGPVMWLGLQCIIGMAAGVAFCITPETFAEGEGVIVLTGLRVGAAILFMMGAGTFVLRVLRPGQVLRIDQDGLTNAQHRGFSFQWLQVRGMGEGFEDAGLARLRFIIEDRDGRLNLRELVLKDWDAPPEKIVNAIRLHLGPGMSALKDVTPTQAASGGLGPSKFPIDGARIATHNRGKYPKAMDGD